jgi:hypothetical protein
MQVMRIIAHASANTSANHRFKRTTMVSQLIGTPMHEIGGSHGNDQT